MKKKPYLRIGRDEPAEGKAVYELVVDDYFEELNPPKQLGVESMSPAMYYVTSGDAVQKALKLKKDLYAYAGNARSALNSIKSPSKSSKEFVKKCWSAASKCNQLIKDLEAARGDDVFLETERDIEGKLKCIPKNPRIKKSS